MTWNLHFQISGRNGGGVPRSARRSAGQVLSRCLNEANNIGLVVLEPDDAEPLNGFIQILLREGSEADFVLLLGALQGLARKEPDVLVTASDEFYLTGEDVLDVGEPRGVLEPDPTSGAGPFRTNSAATDQLYRAPSTEMDSHAVARLFLDHLSSKQLVEWNGPQDHAVEQVAQLVVLIQKGRWRGADHVLRILEGDEAVDELFATDSQLDELWRQVLNERWWPR